MSDVTMRRTGADDDAWNAPRLEEDLMDDADYFEDELYAEMERRNGEESW